MNKKSLKIIITIVLSLVLLFALSACKNEGGDSDPTPTPTKEVERTATPTPPPTATPAPTPKPLPDEQKGIPQEDAEEIFRDEFENDMISAEAQTRGGALDFYAVVDGQLKLSHDGSNYIDNWDSYAPDFYLTVGEEHNQYEFYVDLETNFGDPDSVWMGCFLGARVTDSSGDGSIPTNPNAGFFVAISETQATIYPGSEGQWHEGLASVELPEPASEMHTYIIIDDGTCLYYYVVLSNGERHLLLKADVSGDETIVTDNNGEEILRCDNYIKGYTGGFFKLFNHMGYTVVDKVVLKGSK